VRFREEECGAGPNASGIGYSIALREEELEEAYRLVWSNYVEVGLQEDDQAGIRFTKYHLLPQTKVFVARLHNTIAGEEGAAAVKAGAIVGTVTVVSDTSMGLPMEEFCANEIAQLRNQGRRPAEVIGFALHPDFSSYKVFLPLFKLLFQYALYTGVTDLCCSVTERHIRFYRKLLQFDPMGELVSYSAAHKLKVQGHRLNLDKAADRAKEYYSCRNSKTDLHHFFFSEKYRREEEAEKPFSEEFIHSLLTEKTRFIDSLHEKDLVLLREEYQKRGVFFPF
jgi:hypothetical protein